MAETPTPVTLHHASLPADLTTAVDLVRTVLDERTGRVMWWSPAAARWQRLPGDPDATTFELRAFDAEAEVRWLRSPTGGDLSILASDAGRQSVPDHHDLTWASTAYANSLPSSYLLWGEASDSGHLVESRIGEIDLPVSEPVAGSRYQLAAIEYVAVDASSGSAYVAEERLVGIHPVVVESAQEEGT